MTFQENTSFHNMSNSSPLPSPGVSTMPPLPQCLKSLLRVGGEYWKDVEKIQTLRTLIQPNFEEAYSSGNRAAHYLPMDKYKLRRDRSASPATPTKPREVFTFPRDTGQKSRDTSTMKKAADGKSERTPGTGSLDAAIAHLRDEMVTLRKLDVSLLCQLCTLNESIQEYKQMVQERLDTTSESSSLYSMDMGMESISTIEEEDSDTISYCSRTGSCSDEPIYLEPKSEPYYANITTAKQRWLYNVNQPIYENVFRETSC